MTKKMGSLIVGVVSVLVFAFITISGVVRHYVAIDSGANSKVYDQAARWPISGGNSREAASAPQSGSSQP